MPVRIYEIAKKLGIEQKVVLARAKALGIAHAKVASSALDKITAEWLENELAGLVAPPPKPGMVETNSGSTSPGADALSTLDKIAAELLVKERPNQVPPQPTGAFRDRTVAAVQLEQGRSPEVLPLTIIELAQVTRAMDENPAQTSSQAGKRELAEKELQPSGVSPSSPPATTPAPQTAPMDRAKRGAEATQNRAVSGADFEKQVRCEIEAVLPRCTLSNVLVFDPVKARLDDADKSFRNDFAVELDHLLHATDGKHDYLVMVECKAQPVQPTSGWTVYYPSPTGESKAHSARDQVINQAKAIWRYLNPVARGRSLRIVAFVVSSDSNTLPLTYNAQEWLKLRLCNLAGLVQALRKMRPQPLRVSQSDLLGLLWLGIPVPELGHPELGNALEYVGRCRRYLDEELFRMFRPTKERWAINGSAGMGKSVLLAYSLFVLTTDKLAQPSGDGVRLVDFGPSATELGLPPLEKRSIFAFALKEKQRRVIEALYKRFVEEFSRDAQRRELGIRHPVIGLWNGQIPTDCHVLLLD